MLRKSLNRILAENLRTLMIQHGHNESSLAKKAGIAPNTIGNYCEVEPLFTAKGKERSAKLAEIDAIAAALGVHPLALLTDQVEQLARAQQIAQILAGEPPPTPTPASPRKRLPRAA